MECYFVQDSVQGILQHTVSDIPWNKLWKEKKSLKNNK